MEIRDENLVWAVRAFVYEHFVATTRPPTVAETASHFHLSPDQAAALYQELHRRHALFLDPDTTAIRMAIPFRPYLPRFGSTLKKRPTGLTLPGILWVFQRRFTARPGLKPGAPRAGSRLASRCGKTGWLTGAI